MIFIVIIVIIIIIIIIIVIIVIIFIIVTVYQSFTMITGMNLFFVAKIEITHTHTHKICTRDNVIMLKNVKCV